MLVLAACDKAPRVIRSPGGHYTLHIANGRDKDGGEVVHALIESGGTTLAIPGEWSAEHYLEFLWDREERLWVESSDVGVTAFKFEGGKWTELTEVERSALPEPAWQKTYPRGGAKQAPPTP